MYSLKSGLIFSGDSCIKQCSLRRRLPTVFYLFAWVPLLFFLATTTRGYAEANWPLVAYPPIFALAIACFPRSQRGIQITLRIWVVVLLSALLLIVDFGASALGAREL